MAGARGQEIAVWANLAEAVTAAPKPAAPSGLRTLSRDDRDRRRALLAPAGAFRADLRADLLDQLVGRKGFAERGVQLPRRG